MADKKNLNHTNPSLSFEIVYNRQRGISTRRGGYYPPVNSKLLFLHPVGKSYASIVDDEKNGFLKAEQTPHSIGIKNPTTSIVAAIADMGG